MSSLSRLETTNYVGLLILGLLVGLIVGSLVWTDTKTIDSRTTPTVATVTLAPDGSAYCPADPSVPHVTPCVNQP